MNAKKTFLIWPEWGSIFRKLMTLNGFRLTDYVVLSWGRTNVVDVLFSTSAFANYPAPSSASYYQLTFEQLLWYTERQERRLSLAAMTDLMEDIMIRVSPNTATPNCWNCFVSAVIRTVNCYAVARRAGGVDESSRDCTLTDAVYSHLKVKSCTN